MGVETLDLTGFERKAFEFSWDGKQYQLREAGSEAGKAYRTALAKCMRLDGKDIASDKSQVLSDKATEIFAIQAKLVQDCLFVKTNSDWVPVTAEQFKDVTDRLVHFLFGKAQEMSDLKTLDPGRKEALKK